MKKDDLNYIAKVERAIADKYGAEAISNPKSGWDEEKEKKYLQELSELYKNSSPPQGEIVDMGSFVIKGNAFLNSGRNRRTCPNCESYSLSFSDDLYMSKYDCCFDCFVEYVEGREARWKTGWRPNK